MKPRSALALLCVGWLFAAGCVVGGITGGVEESAPDNDDNNYNTDTNNPGDDGRSLFFYYGPMKLMLGESFIYSVEAITGHDFGSWDYTAPDPGAKAFVDVGNNDADFYRHCLLLGGCMNHRIPLGRTSFVGTAYVLQMEKAVNEACVADRDPVDGAFGMFPLSSAPGPNTQVIDVINHQYLKAFGHLPSTSELELSIAYFESHIADPEWNDVSPLESAGRGHCRAILASNKFLFY